MPVRSDLQSERINYQYFKYETNSLFVVSDCKSLYSATAGLQILPNGKNAGRAMTRLYLNKSECVPVRYKEITMIASFFL